MQFPSYVSSHDDDIFEDMISECIVIVYMDDIFIFVPDKPTLTENTRKFYGNYKTMIYYLNQQNVNSTEQKSNT